MGKRFKDYYDDECARLIAHKLSQVAGSATFDVPSFTAQVQIQLEADPTFSQRQDIFAAALEQHLPKDYAVAISMLEEILGPPLAEPEGMFTHGWWLWPVGRYVERNALQDRQLSYRFIRELTRRFTGEFAIRPLLRDEPRETFEVLDQWARDDDVHVRRCASEGMRISLPWASRLTVALDHFDLFREVLHHLRADPQRFVQKSVGNNLNDLMKAAPERAGEIIQGWEQEIAEGQTDQRAQAATRWIIRHGTRSLRKAQRAQS